MVAYGETSERRWRRPWFSTLNAASLVYPGLWAGLGVNNAMAHFGCKTKTGVVRIMVIIQDRLIFSLIKGKLSTRPFGSCG